MPRAPDRRRTASRPRRGTPEPANSPPGEARPAPGRTAPPNDSRQGYRPKVVVLAGAQADADEAPGLGPAAPFDVGDPVPVVGLPRHPPHVGGAGLVRIRDAINQHVRLPSHEPGEPLRRNGALDFEQLFETVALDLVGHVVLVLLGTRAVLRRIGERTEPVELCFLEEASSSRTSA